MGQMRQIFPEGEVKEWGQAVSEIFSILQEISYGSNYVEMGLIMRESILISKLLLSAEVWHKLYLYQ